MKKGVRIGALVTVKPVPGLRRAYGRVTAYCPKEGPYGGNRWAVQGKWGLAESYGGGIRPVKKVLP